MSDCSLESSLIVKNHFNIPRGVLTNEESPYDLVTLYSLKDVYPTAGTLCAPGLPSSDVIVSCAKRRLTLAGLLTPSAGGQHRRSRRPEVPFHSILHSNDRGCAALSPPMSVCAAFIHQHFVHT